MRRFLVILMLALSVFCLPLSAQNKDKRSQLEKEIAILDKQIRANNAKTSDALAGLNLTQAKIRKQKALVEESNRELASINSQLAKKQAGIAQAQSRIDTMQFYYNRLVKSAYKNRDPRIWYMYMLSGKDFSQNLRRMSYIKDMSSKMRAQARSIEAEKSLLEQQRKELVALQAESRKVLSQRNSQLNELKTAEAGEQKAIKQLKSEKSRYEKQLAQKRRQAEELQAKARAAASSAGKTVKKGSPDAKLSGQFASAKGSLIWPVSGVVTESFGQHYHPVYKNVKLPFNNGVNIATAVGEDAVAVFEGVVRQVAVMPGYSKCVLVQHGEFYTFYCKLGDVDVKAGDKVKAGQTIGTVDTVAGITEFHFQLWKGTSPQDPEKWLKK